MGYIEQWAPVGSKTLEELSPGDVILVNSKLGEVLEIKPDTIVTTAGNRDVLDFLYNTYECVSQEGD